MSIHHRTHPTFVEGCWACRVATVGVAPSALPTRAPGVRATNQREHQLSKDMTAYKAMKKQGEQPPSMRGAAELQARAECSEHVTTGMTHVKPKAFARYESMFGNKVTEPA